MYYLKLKNRIGINQKITKICTYCSCYIFFKKVNGWIIKQTQRRRTNKYALPQKEEEKKKHGSTNNTQKTVCTKTNLSPRELFLGAGRGGGPCIGRPQGARGRLVEITRWRRARRAGRGGHRPRGCHWKRRNKNRGRQTWDTENDNGEMLKGKKERKEQKYSASNIRDTARK